jgi:hypothetical protein
VKEDLSSFKSHGGVRSGGLWFACLYVLPTLVLIVISFWPLIEGGRTLFFRDVLNTHFEMKWFQAEAMRAGYLPLVDHLRAGGQPHLGNPNTVALYPDNLLYLVAEPLWAMNAHFWMHVLLAPFSLFWLARAWGLRREAAWVGGSVFAVSGYLLSCLNLYNMIAAVVWAPALAAAALKLAAPVRPARWLWATALVWALLIVAGDPITAVLALVLATTAVAAKHGLRGAAWGKMALAVGLGTMLAAPLVLEFLRILSLSFRGHWGFSVRAATAGSWHPARTLEWFLPMAFGRPNLVFWGHRFHAGFPPLIYSLSPGLLAIGLAIAGCGVNGRLKRWASWSIVGGLFFALGRSNPVVAGLLMLPGAGLLRMPVKFWLVVSVGVSLLAALGVERVLSRDRDRALRRALGLMAGLFAALWLVLVLASAGIESQLREWIPAALPPGLAAAERLRWAGLALLSLILALASLAVAYFGRKRVTWVLPVLLVMHITSQLFFLRPLFESDDVDAYRTSSPAAEIIPAGARVVHGTDGSLFEEAGIALRLYPNSSSRWLHRQMFREFFPSAGIMAGRRFEFTLSPEGLDSFLTRATVQALERLDDPQRVRVLEASGVEWLLLRRELDPQVVESGDVELAGSFDSAGSTVHIYRLLRSAEEAQFVGTLHSSENLNDALARIVAPAFDPRSEVVLAGRSQPGSGADGEVIARVVEGERMVWDVEAQGAGALLVQRSHLPLYRATVDGKPTPIYAANLHRMAIPLETGAHSVELRVDRSRFYLGIGLALVALAILLVVSRGKLALKLGMAHNSG